jgi:osmoprotectant transport system permease protein
LGIILFGIAIFLPLFDFKPNRIGLGFTLSTQNIFNLNFIYLIIVILLIWISLLEAKRGIQILKALFPQLIFLFPWIMIFLLLKNPKIIPSNLEWKILSPSGGFWLFILSSWIMQYALKHEIRKKYIINIFQLCSIFIIILLGITGNLSQFSLLMEFINRRETVLFQLGNHIQLTLIITISATLLGISLGILAWKFKKSEKPIFLLINSIQTIPSLALFSFLIAPLAFLSAAFPLLKEMGIKGIGRTPAIIALTLYAILPILRNTFTSFAVIDENIKEAGKGMGMTKFQLLFKIEFPISIPIILRGIRTAAVQTVGNITVAALINAGGLGIFIMQGMTQAALDLVLMGTIPIVFLAIITDRLMKGIEKWATPKGLKERGND